MIQTIEYDSKIGDIVRSIFHELEYLRNITDSCKSKFLNYFQNKLFERYFFTLYNCFQSNIDDTDIYNVDIIYRSAIKYVKDAIQCTENSFIFVVLNDYLETLEKSYSDLKDEMEIKSINYTINYHNLLTNKNSFTTIVNASKEESDLVLSILNVKTSEDEKSDLFRHLEKCLIKLGKLNEHDWIDYININE